MRQSSLSHDEEIIVMLLEEKKALVAERDALREALEQLDKIAEESAGVIAAVWLRRYIADALERPE
jgi:hypothetical protein